MTRNKSAPSKPTNKIKTPDDLPIYRLLTGVDNRAFCERVSKAITLGYELYGSPAITFNGENCIVAQALIWSAAVKSRKKK